MDAMPKPHSVLSLRTAPFAGELLKVYSLPAMRRTLLLGAITVAAVAAFGVFQTIRIIERGRGDEISGLRVADWPMLALHFGLFIPIVLGAWVFGQDSAKGPRQTAFLAVSRRLQLAYAKLATVVLVLVVAGIVCTVAALAPLAFWDASREGAGLDLARHGWLIGYWVLMGLMAASIAAATRSMVLAVVPLLAWVLGLSDLLTARFPILAAAIDQVAKAAYLDGLVPSPSHLIAVAIQVIVLVVAGMAAYARRDSA